MSARFFVLHEGLRGTVAERVAALGKAAEARNIGFLSLDSLETDYSAIPPLFPGDMLFNCGRGSARLETLLISPAVTTFYVINPDVIYDVSDSTLLTIHHDKLGLPSPKTVHRLSADRALLSRYMDYLGGFPVVIKMVGGTLGIGTILVDSMPSLLSIADYIVTQGRDFILRQYIPAREIARLIVLGTEVIVANRKFIAHNDFRSSARDREIASYDPSIEHIAIQAARSCNQEFAGVDILITPKGEPYLLETNSPCDFWTAELQTGVPIAQRMVDYLIQKASLRL